MQGNAQFSLSGGVERIERPEVIAGPTGRRSWSDEAKGRVVLESHGLGARVVDVARRHGVAAQQVTTWRREARQGKLDTRKNLSDRGIVDDGQACST